MSVKKYKIRVIQDGNRFYPQCKFKRLYEYFYTDGGYPVYFLTIQAGLDYMMERLYAPKNKENKMKIVYQGTTF